MLNSKIKKKNYQLPFHRFWFLVHAKTSSNLRFIVFFCTFMYKKEPKNEEKTNKRKATTTTEICNTVGYCKCKPCQKLSTLK